MTWEEFNEFVAHHSAAYPIKEWLKRQDEPQRISESWYRILGDLDFADCIAASDMLARGDEKQPTGYSNHPRAIRAIAKRLREGRAKDEERERPIYGVESYRCAACQDTGRRIVLKPKFINAVREAQGWPEKHFGVTCAVACTCNHGVHTYGRERYNPVSKTQIPAMPVFDPNIMIESFGENRDQLVALVLGDR